MAKTAAKFTLIGKLPKDLPEHLSLADVKMTVNGKDDEGNATQVKDAVVSVVFPERTGAGIVAYQTFYNDHNKVEGQDGNLLLAGALQSAIVNGVRSRLTPTTLNTSPRILPLAAFPRTIDKATVYGDKLAEMVRSGQLPDAEVEKLFASMRG